MSKRVIQLTQLLSARDDNLTVGKDQHCDSASDRPVHQPGEDLGSYEQNWWYLSSIFKGNLTDLTFLLRLFTVNVIIRLRYSKSFRYLDEGIDLFGFLAISEAAYKLSILILEILFSIFYILAVG